MQSEPFGPTVGFSRRSRSTGRRGSQLRVEPLAPPGEKTGLSEDEWRDDPDSIAAWIEAVETIEPLVWAEGEEEELERWREKCRQFNIEAVRRQMDVMPEGDTP